MKDAMSADQMGRMRKLTEMSHALASASSLDEMFRLVADYAVDLVAGERSLLLVANDAGMLAVRASRGLDQVVAGHITERFCEPLTETTVTRLAALLEAPQDCMSSVPLVVAGAIRGILIVLRPAAPQDPDYDEWLLSALADHAAVALETNRLNQLGEFREQLIGIVGHDLRTPLSMILMGAQVLLEREGLGAYETEIARKITTSAGLATRLIDQLLDLTRSRLGGGIQIDRAPVDLNDICRQVVGEIQLTHPDRPLTVDVDGDLTGLFDADRIYQLLANLVGNAVRHGASRSPIALSICGAAGGVVIEVANKGEPIPPAMLPIIFDAFRKKRSANASRSHGLGLGLFIAQQIARSHGGSIAVSSSDNDGTSFRVNLPRVVGDAMLK
jgi:signal transduction histidine kinase